MADVSAPPHVGGVTVGGAVYSKVLDHNYMEIISKASVYGRSYVYKIISAKHE